MGSSRRQGRNVGRIWNIFPGEASLARQQLKLDLEEEGEAVVLYLGEGVSKKDAGTKLLQQEGIWRVEGKEAKEQRLVWPE